MSFDKWLPEIYVNPKAWLAAIISSGDADLTLELIQKHPDLLETRLTGNATPLHLAAYSQHPEIAAALLEKGAKIDFIAAIALRRSELVGAMLDARPALLCKRSPDGWTALHIAARCSTAEVVSMLIARGADVNGLGKQGRTPIFFALREPFENAGLLLAHGANVNTRGKHGVTPLHCAAASGYAPSVKFLVAHGADANLQTDARQTAWCLAVRGGHREVASLLASL